MRAPRIHCILIELHTCLRQPEIKGGGAHGITNIPKRVSPGAHNTTTVVSPQSRPARTRPPGPARPWETACPRGPLRLAGAAERAPWAVDLLVVGPDRRLGVAVGALPSCGLVCRLCCRHGQESSHCGCCSHQQWQWWEQMTRNKTKNGEIEQLHPMAGAIWPDACRVLRNWRNLKNRWFMPLAFVWCAASVTLYFWMAEYI